LKEGNMSGTGGRDPKGEGRQAEDTLLQEARATRTLRPARAAVEFFWGNLAPMALLSAIASATAVFVLGVSVLGIESTKMMQVAALTFVVTVIAFIPLEYYMVRTRIEEPLITLEHELRGTLPWRPEEDILLAPVRRAIEQVRETAQGAKSDLLRQQERVLDLQSRLEEQGRVEQFLGSAATALRAAEPVEQFCTRAAALVREAWPAEHVLILITSDQDLDMSIAYYERDGACIDVQTLGDDGPRYRKASLPAPVKDAMRRGFYADAGLPFSRDPAFPQARSFVAMSLEHRGAPAGVLLAASSALTPPSAEPLRRARPLFSMSFSRSMYLRETEEAAIRDALTGAYTHDHFLSMLRHEVARSNRYAHFVTCMLIDIDGLRRINEAYGSSGGDQVITEVAELVKGLIRSSDTLARMSGGELALLLPETTSDAALIVAERVRAKVEEHPYILQRSQVERVTVTVGSATHPPHGITALSLVDTAQKVLRQAKRAGKNRVGTALIEKADGAGPEVATAGVELVEE
jgi:diguanylate cyclase (GGDEF)-like protein